MDRTRTLILTNCVSCLLLRVSQDIELNRMAGNTISSPAAGAILAVVLSRTLSPSFFRLIEKLTVQLHVR